MDFTGNYIAFRLYEKLEWEIGRIEEEEICNDKFPSWKNLSGDSGSQPRAKSGGAEVEFN